ncbi:MAG: bifunctional diaminohydroxyphosphoribosylaminopyrimidine deaminase/5-amino-6-(5-phosphoribosylamino)uracil reductase RibD [Reyranella sp.]|nr:bifunctional diaminohydroxyphosphoribosylaminopyrimidine deaminase/5-amino-6-(5-phosphoribosylamino)uracil reductase RibD [Reyranella sp.]
MRAALTLARRSLGRTWPNPAVGCVIVRDGRVIARGRTQDGGRPHAEAYAIANAREPLKDATVYVTLEPCAHHGRTPPCADALIAAGVGRVISAIEDPDPRVKGQGHARLAAAGIAVEVGEGAAAAAEINAGFFLRVREGRPLIHLKLASSLDGRIATASGESRWITSEAARADGHRLRSIHDAILVGAGTVAADDPELTCRLPGLGAYSPDRIVLDSTARMSATSKLAATARATPVLLFHAGAPSTRVALLQEKGINVIEATARGEGQVDIVAAARTLGEMGYSSVLIEGGGQIAAAFLRAGLVDRISSYRAGVVLGEDSRSAVGPLALGRLDFAPRFRLVSSRIVGADTLETWYRRT